MQVLNPTEPAIVQGIKTVGIGKKGSKPLTPDLIAEILRDLKENKVSDIARGAFFGALFSKGITLDEMRFDDAFASGTLMNPSRLGKIISHDAPSFVQESCVKLLKVQTLDQKSAYKVGEFLLSKEKGEGARGLIASVLRVRYETEEEYSGLLKSFEDSIEPSFRQPVPSGEPIIQLAEPFDGVDQSYMITPLVAQYLQAQNYRVVNLTGRNSGPKFGNNALDLAQALNIPLAKGNQELVNPKPAFGWYINQPDLSKSLDQWVERRWAIVKRPCFATLEKFLNPVKAQIIITSAFHAPYSEKMTRIAENAGFPASIVIRNGLEGSLAFPLMRPVKLLCSARQKDGSYLREEITLDPQADFGLKVSVEEKLENPSLEENARLVKEFSQKQITNNTLFDQRVKFTCEGVKRALTWINDHKRRG